MRRLDRSSASLHLVVIVTIGACLHTVVAIVCCIFRPGLTNDYGDPSVADLRTWAATVPAGFPREPSGTVPNWLGFGFYTMQMLSEPSDNPNRSLSVLYLVRSGWPMLSFEGTAV